MAGNGDQNFSNHWKPKSLVFPGIGKDKAAAFQGSGFFQAIIPSLGKLPVEFSAPLKMSALDQ
jgi:hypothetical protein